MFTDKDKCLFLLYNRFKEIDCFYPPVCFAYKTVRHPWLIYYSYYNNSKRVNMDFHYTK